VLGSSNRPLKSLTDMIKGKQGRFREKPARQARRLLRAFGHRRRPGAQAAPVRPAEEDRAGAVSAVHHPQLKEHGLADTIKSPRRCSSGAIPEVWDILEECIYQHPVMLNRAPTLHRMGIQAFEPVLVEGQRDQDPPARV
jgi:DNA-directed RNA polymerase subunit beta'